MDIGYGILGTGIFISILSAVLFYKIFKSIHHKTEEEAIIARERLLNVKFSNYSMQRKFDEMKLFLSQYGVSYILGSNITPQGYMVFKLLFAAVVMLGVFLLLGGGAVNIVICISAGIASYLLFDAVIRSNNESDNDNMFEDIKTIYQTMIIQSTAGVFISDSLIECYRQVKNKRLKNALKDLTNTIITKHDVEGALSVFSVKFKNQYIDSLVTTIEQSLQSGQSVKLLEDISKQLSDVEHAMHAKRQAAMDTKVTIIQVLVLAVIVIMLIYGVFVSIKSSIGTF